MLYELQHMQLLIAKLPELHRLNCVGWSEHSFDVEEWIRIFLRSKIDWLCLTLLTLKKLMYEYLSIELQADIWHRQIFNTAIFKEVSGGVCLEAHGLNVSRTMTANEFDDQSSNEHQRKKRRAN
jgi:hypothetical protein